MFGLIYASVRLIRYRITQDYDQNYDDMINNYRSAASYYGVLIGLHSWKLAAAYWYSPSMMWVAVIVEVVGFVLCFFGLMITHIIQIAWAVIDAVPSIVLLVKISNKSMTPETYPSICCTGAAAAAAAAADPPQDSEEPTDDEESSASEESNHREPSEEPFHGQL